MLVSFPQCSYNQVKLLTCQLLPNDGGCFIGVQGSSVLLQICLFQVKSLAIAQIMAPKLCEA